MKVSAMGSYNYFSEVRKATAKAGGTYSESLSNIGNVSSNITLHYFGTEESGNALTAVGFSDGSSASVYKADNYNQADPEYTVRYWDKEGNYSDTNVKVNEVDPSNASYLEMLAYATNSDARGMTKNAYGNFLQAASGVNGNITYDAESINEKKNYMNMVKEFMQLQYDCNNLTGYLSFQQFYDYMKDKAEN